jgi:hypothetical protein
MADVTFSSAAIESTAAGLVHDVIHSFIPADLFGCDDVVFVAGFDKLVDVLAIQVAGTAE